jgi:hypothetical protein
MGYRKLLKKYIRFLEMYAGDNCIEAITYVADHEIGERDLAELRTLAGEIHRDARSSDALAQRPNFNYQLRLLCICYGLTPECAARLAGVDITTLRRWRTNPRSPRHLAMRRTEFLQFEGALLDWLERKRCAVEGENR